MGLICHMSFMKELPNPFVWHWWEIQLSKYLCWGVQAELKCVQSPLHIGSSQPPVLFPATIQGITSVANVDCVSSYAGSPSLNLITHPSLFYQLTCCGSIVTCGWWCWFAWRVSRGKGMVRDPTCSGNWKAVCINKDENLEGAQIN